MTPVRVEVLVLGTHGGELHYTVRHANLTEGRHPDATAAALAAATSTAATSTVAAVAGPDPLTLLHSTSWRFMDGGVVLTYAAVLDGTPAPGARPLPAGHGLAHSTDPRAPSPPHVCPDAVATHAARHLAWLREHDDVAGAALAAVPALWTALDHHTPAPAGAVPA